MSDSFLWSPERSPSTHNRSSSYTRTWPSLEQSGGPLRCSEQEGQKAGCSVLTHGLLLKAVGTNPTRATLGEELQCPLTGGVRKLACSHTKPCPSLLKACWPGPHAAQKLGQPAGTSRRPKVLETADELEAAQGPRGGHRQQRPPLLSLHQEEY